MATHKDLIIWVEKGLRKAGGEAQIIDVAKFIWDNYEKEPRASGNLFYSWQYRMRWAATQLRNRQIMKPANPRRRGVWTLQ